MSKYVVVTPDQVPSPLRDGEWVINPPTFIEEIELAQNRRNNARKLTTAPYLRSIGNMIAIAYDPTFNALTGLHAHRYTGREYNNVQELSLIVLDMFRNDYPVIFERYIDKKIKERPNRTKLVYYTGDPKDTAVFIQNGLDNMDVKEVDYYLGLKSKKVVGRPALSKEDSVL